MLLDFQLNMKLRFVEKNSLSIVLWIIAYVYTLLHIIDFTYLALGCYIVFENDKNEVGFLFNGILLTAPYINCSIENGNFFIVTDRVRDSDCFNR